MKKTIARMSLALIAFSMLAACAMIQVPPEDPSSSEITQPQDLIIAPPFESVGLMKFQGDGFSFFYPDEALLEIASGELPQISSVTVRGPDILVSVGTAEWNTPGYTIVVRTYDNPDGLDTEAYGRAFLISLWERILAEGGPLSIPVSQEGIIREDDVGTATVAGLPAFYVEWFGGDHTRMEYFIANGDQVVSFSFGDYPVPNQPINEVQQGIYSLIMSTLELESE